MSQERQADNGSAAATLQPAIIAIDGPAASGKSTVGYQVAQALNFLFFDTGVMYRAVTWAAQEAGSDPADQDAMDTLANRIVIDVAPPGPDQNDGRQCTVLVDGEDVTWAIRAPAVDRAVSTVSAQPAVREALSRQQRRIGLLYGSGQGDKPGMVMVGRDIGTVVLPDAGLKIFLDASPAERARRRFCELRRRGKEIAFEDVYDDMVDRDRVDTERAHSPLRAADDALIVDTSELSPAAAAAAIVQLAAGSAASAA